MATDQEILTALRTQMKAIIDRGLVNQSIRDRAAAFLRLGEIQKQIDTYERRIDVAAAASSGDGRSGLVAFQPE